MEIKMSKIGSAKFQELLRLIESSENQASTGKTTSRDLYVSIISIGFAGQDKDSSKQIFGDVVITTNEECIEPKGVLDKLFRLIRP